MSITEKSWYIYIGSSFIGTLIPTGSDDNWYYADFSPGDAWGNFAPWFKQALDAHMAGDEGAWEGIYSQLALMGLTLSSDDGESYDNPTVHIDGDRAWFVV